MGVVALRTATDLNDVYTYMSIRHRNLGEG